MADTAFTNATQILEPFKGVKKVTLEEYFTSGHRTCQGCESALVMKLMVKAAGPRTIVLGSTGCMYVANTTYYTTPWVVPWMHTQLGSSGSAALGTAAGLKALMKKGKMKSEPINVIAFCGDGGGADMGLGAISATLTHKEYNSLILMYDNESYANTDIQLSGSTPYGANTTFSPPGSVKRIIHTRWKKNTAGMLAAGHPECRYVATVDASYAVEMMNKVRKALTIGGPTFIHSLDPCPKGWDYDPMLSHELGELAVETGVFPLYEVEDGVVRHYGKTKAIVEGRPRKPVREYLLKQGRFAHFTEEDLDYFQSKVDEMWDKWEIPGVIPFWKERPGQLAVRRPQQRCPTPTTRRGHDPSLPTTRDAGSGHPGRRTARVPPAAHAWEPTKPIEFVIPAGTGGGADQMARLIAGIVEKHKLSPRPIIVVNKSGGAGAEGFLHVKGKKGDAHTMIITLSNLFTTPLHTGVPFNWKDLSPIARMALDEFILWVNAETPYKTAKEYLAAVKERSGGDRMKMAGTGSAQEDQILTIQLEQALGVKFTYVPFKGGGEVCVNLVGKHVDSTVNNPIECASHWKAGRVRPLAVFDTARIAVAGVEGHPDREGSGGRGHQLPDAARHLRPPRHAQGRGGLVPGPAEEGLRHAGVQGLPEPGRAQAGLGNRSRAVKWLGQAEQLHRDLMTKGGLLKK